MNTGTRPAEQKIFEKTIDIHAPAARVWNSLTTPAIMKEWMIPDLELGGVSLGT